MKKSILSSAIAAATVISITACSSGGSDVAGIGGSGVTSSGTITGFGSIFVNGVEFHTNSSNFSVDDNPGSESDLAIGMRVTVKGTLNADGVSGTATSVTFDDQVQGPVDGLTENADQTVKTFIVLGTTVLASSADTSFDVSGSNPLNPASFGYADLADGNNVEISGFFNTSGELEATRIELKDLAFDPSNIVELRGTITGLIGTDFTINGINIDAAGAAIDDLPGGLAENAFVEVKGTCADASCNPIIADRVEGESEGFDDDGDFEVEGLITDFNGNDDFKVAGLPVDASGATLIPSTLVLADDLKVEAEGNVVNGILIASEVKQRGGENKIHGLVTSVTSNQMEVEVDRGDNESVTVIVTTETEMEDDVDDQQPFNIGDIVPGVDYVEVRGFADASNNVTATQLQVKDPDDYIVQGVITAGSAGSSEVTVLGVTMPFNSNTDFEDANDTPFADAAAFFGAITVGTTVIKVQDKESAGGGNTPIGTADEIEIED